MRPHTWRLAHVTGHFQPAEHCPMKTTKQLQRKHPMKRKGKVKKPTLQQKHIAERAPKACNFPSALLNEPFTGLKGVPKHVPGRSEAYKAFLRTKPCCVCGAEGRTEVAHQGRHGVSTKASDFGALPMCGTVAGFEGCHQRSHRAGMMNTLNTGHSRGLWFRLSDVQGFIDHHSRKLLIEYLERGCS